MNNLNSHQNSPNGSEYVNGVLMSEYANMSKDGEVTYETGPTFKEILEKENKGSGKPKIVAKKMYKNAIAEVKLDDGRTMDIDTAVEFAKEFGLDNVTVGRARNGRQILRANPTDNPDKALRNLPSYK